MLAGDCEPSGQMAITYQEKQLATEVGTMVLVVATFHTMDIPSWLERQQAGS